MYLTIYAFFPRRSLSPKPLSVSLGKHKRLSGVRVSFPRGKVEPAMTKVSYSVLASGVLLKPLAIRYQQTA